MLVEQSPGLDLVWGAISPSLLLAREPVENRVIFREIRIREKGACDSLTRILHVAFTNTYRPISSQAASREPRSHTHALGHAPSYPVHLAPGPRI